MKNTVYLSEKSPHLILEWDFKKNQSLDPYKLTHGSNKKVWWLCKKGHSWKASINSRTYGNHGCPYCSSLLTSLENSIAKTHPYLLEEWDYHKNNELKITPETVSKSSDKKVWWLCKTNPEHSWETQIKVRTHGSNRPFCNNKRITKKKSLGIVNPTLSAEWNKEKNKDLTPFDISPGSSKKVWWKCVKGHEWESTVSNRAKGRGCPYCANKIVTPENSLGKKHPDLISEWNTEKNGSTTPFNISPGSSKRVWWKCSKGHEWKTSVSNRATKGTKCPYCSGRKVCDDNSLATLHPDLATEWHPIKNLNLTPNDVTCGSGKKVWWKCFWGHEWQARIINRTNTKNQTGCPHCNTELGTSLPEQTLFFYLSKVFTDIFNKFTLENSKLLEVDIYIPEINLCIEYDGYKYHKEAANLKRDQKKNSLLNEYNYKLLRIREKSVKALSLPDIEMYGADYFEYLPKSGYRNLNHCIDKIIRYLLDNFTLTDSTLHSIENLDVDISRDKLKIISTFKNNFIANSLAEKSPELVAQWNYKKNFSLKPEQFKPYSNTVLWWICSKGHEWKASINRRSSGIGCPFCAGKRSTPETSLHTINPKVAAEWHPDKNGVLTPHDVTTGSGKKVWWKCTKGHEWEAQIYTRAQNNLGCPFCSGRQFTEERSLSNTYPEIAKEWNYEKNGTLTPDKISFGNAKKVWWKCSKGHEWETSINLRTNQNTQCPYCCNQKICSDNCLATLRPDLLLEWDYERNSSIDPEKVGIGTGKKAWWICKVCGHSWGTAIRSRAKNNTGCPVCHKRKIKNK